MVLMAGMLPGVECARRRRIRQGVAEAPCGTRRPSLCLYAGGHDRAHLGSSGCSQERSKGTWTLDSNAREAKERLDHKLRSQRESVVKRGTSTSKAQAASSGSDGMNQRSFTAAAEEARTTATTTCALQREVLTKNEAGRRRFTWSRLGRRTPPPAPAIMECAVCLEELRAGDVLVQLPCAHRFHWACAVPWVKAASRCPVCRAQVHTSPAHQVPHV